MSSLCLDISGSTLCDDQDYSLHLCRSMLYYYNDKKSFEEKPEESINRRPISLEGLSLRIDSQEPPYSFSLHPVDEDDDRRPIEYRRYQTHRYY